MIKINKIKLKCYEVDVMEFKKLFLILIILFFCQYSFSSTPGTSALDFLKLDVSVKNSAMGGVGTALENSVFSLGYNPALIGYNSIYPVVGFSYNQWIVEMSEIYAGLIIPKERYSFATAIRYFNEGEVKGVNSSGLLTGETYRSYNMALQFGFANVLNDNPFGWGISAKIISSSFGGETSSSFCFDGGIIYQTSSMLFGLSIMNAGDKVKIANREDNLALLLRAGISYNLIKNKFIVSVDGIKPSDEAFLFGAGGEFWLTENIALRAGYRSGRELLSWSAGLGFSFDNFYIDYAFIPQNKLDPTHRFALSLTFGKKEEVVTVEKEAPVIIAPQEKKPEFVEVKPKREIEVTKIPKGLLLSMTINFDFDKAVIRPDDYYILREAGDVIKQYLNSKVQVIGHTDAIGTEEYNLGLSMRRAKSAQDFLIFNEGINSDRFLEPLGYGESMPVATNKTPEGRFRNRRVEIVIYTGETEDYSGKLNGIYYQVQEKEYIIDLSITGNYQVRDFVLDEPPCLVVDLLNVKPSEPVYEKQKMEINLGNIKNLVLGFNEVHGFTRITINFKGPTSYVIERGETLRIKLSL